MGAKSPSTLVPIDKPRPRPKIATVVALGAGYSCNMRTSPSNITAMATANGASLAFMNMCP